MINRKITISTISIFTSLALMASATYAYFTDTATSQANTFTSGTVKVKLEETGEGYTPFNIPNMAPGDIVYRCIELQNTGSLNFSGTVTLINTATPTTTPDLNNVLNGTIYSWNTTGVPTAADCNTGSTTSWTQLTTGTLKDFSPSGYPFGSVNSGTQKYYKFAVELPSGTTNAYQGGMATYQLKVDVTQAL